MCDQGPVANLEEVLVQYRLHDSQTSISKAQEAIGANYYAIHRAKCRMISIPPKSFEHFIHDTTLLDQWRWKVEAWAMIQYRTARIQIANGKKLEAILRIILLAISRPISTVTRIAKLMAGFLRCQFN
jgi:hypothetical protein